MVQNSPPIEKSRVLIMDDESSVVRVLSRILKKLGFEVETSVDGGQAVDAYESLLECGGFDARDQMDWNPEWSSRCRGIATYAAIRELGRSGLAELIDRTCGHAHSLVTRIGALDGAEMMYEPQINQGLVRFLSPVAHATDIEHNSHTDYVISKIQATGEAFFGGTTWNDRRCMRISVSNWQTDEKDVDRAVEAVRKVLKEP